MCRFMCRTHLRCCCRFLISHQRLSAITNLLRHVNTDMRTTLKTCMSGIALMMISSMFTSPLRPLRSLRWYKKTFVKRCLFLISNKPPYPGASGSSLAGCLLWLTINQYRHNMACVCWSDWYENVVSRSRAAAGRRRLISGLSCERTNDATRHMLHARYWRIVYASNTLYADRVFILAAHLTR